MVREYPYPEVHKLMSSKMGVLGYSDYVELRQLRRVVGLRSLQCTGVELGLSWLAWYEGNIVVDGYVEEADRVYEHPCMASNQSTTIWCLYSGWCGCGRSGVYCGG